LFVLNGFFFFQQFSGIYVVVYYAVDIILQAGVSMDKYVGAVLLGVVQFLAGVAVSFALTRQVTFLQITNVKGKLAHSTSNFCL
jgi:hypothetical protein